MKDMTMWKKEHFQTVCTKYDYPGNPHNLPSPFIERVEDREHYTLPKGTSYFVIDLWINMTWFRLDDKYDSQEQAERQSKHYNMPPPLRIVECKTEEIKVYQAREVD